MQVHYKQKLSSKSIANSSDGDCYPLSPSCLSAIFTGGAGVRRVDPANVCPSSGVAGLGLSYKPYRAVLEKSSIVERPRYALTAYSGASLLEFRPVSLCKSRLKRDGVVGTVRGQITSFSNRSRCRLKKEFHRVRRVHLTSAYFATLTYPSDYERWSVAETKQHLRSLCKRLRRRFPDVALIWKLEPQRRGAPHYHLCILGICQPSDVGKRQWLGDMRCWLADAWYSIVGSGDIKHLKAGTQFDPVKSPKHAGFYISKYFGKDEHQLSDPRPGRFWGTFGSIERYYGSMVRYEVSALVATQMFRVFDAQHLSNARQSKEVRRARSVCRARRRRSDARSRWHVGSVDQLLRWFLACDSRETSEQKQE